MCSSSPSQTIAQATATRRLEESQAGLRQKKSSVQQLKWWEMRNTKEELATVIFMLLDDEIWWNMMKYDEIWWNMMKYDEIWWTMIFYPTIEFNKSTSFMVTYGIILL